MFSCGTIGNSPTQMSTGRQACWGRLRHRLYRPRGTLSGQEGGRGPLIFSSDYVIMKGETIWNKYLFTQKCIKMFLFYSPTSVTTKTTYPGNVLFLLLFCCAIYLIYFEKRFALYSWTNLESHYYWWYRRYERVIVAFSLFESAEAENRHKNIFTWLIFEKSCLFMLTCCFICTIAAQRINNLSLSFNAIEY